jgi:hypothetical protein
LRLRQTKIKYKPDITESDLIITLRDIDDLASDADLEPFGR